MKVSSISILAAAILTVGMVASPVSAGGLLGGVVKTVTDTVGSTVDTVSSTVSEVTGGGGGGGSGNGGSGGNGGNIVGDIVSLNGGGAGNSALVNLGAGSDPNAPNNVLDLNVGKGSSKIAKLNVSAGSNLTVGLNLLGLQLDLGVSGIGDLLGGDDDDDQDRDNRGNVRVASNGGANTFLVNCSVNDGRKVLQLASQAKFAPKNWVRAANVQVVPMKLCPAARKQVAQIFNASGKVQQLQRAAAADALITASLGRTKYDIGDIFAVQQNASGLIVYVY